MNTRSAAGLPSWQAGRPASEAGSTQPQRLMLRDHHFEAMGCHCQVMTLGGGAELLTIGENRVRQLEDSWTRFDAGSELCEFNSRSGHWERVSPDLFELLARGLAGWRISAGAFDPFLAKQIVRAGYDRDFSALEVPNAERPDSDSDGGKPASRVRRRRRRAAPVALRRGPRLARLAPGVGFDSGGIGKGLGADLVTAHLMAAGAAGVMVSLGGDVRVRGMWPDDGWRIGITDPTRSESSGLHVTLRDGGLCTSGTLKRRWVDAAGSIANHILDPRTGRPLRPSELVAVTAIARQGWRAEVLTKVGLVAGLDQVRAMSARNPDVAFLVWDRHGQMSQVQ